MKGVKTMANATFSGDVNRPGESCDEVADMLGMDGVDILDWECIEDDE